MGFDLDTGPLAEALRLKVQFVRSGAMADPVNKAMRDVTLRTIQFSPVVGATQIAGELERVIGQRTHGKSGRALKRPRPITKPTSLARAIVVSRLLKKGTNPRTIGGAEVDQMVRQMIAARKRSVGFLKSGYLPASKLLGAGTQGVVQFGPDHGSVKLATAGDLFAMIRNDVPTLWKNDPLAYTKAEEALQAAVDFVEADILIYVDRKLRETGFS